MDLMNPIDHADLVLLTSWLCERGYGAKAVAQAVEKPWNWIEELDLAKAVYEHESATDHTCLPYGTDEDYWYCSTQPCDWTYGDVPADDPEPRKPTER